MESLPLVVPVRFSGGGLTMQTTTGRIAADAIFVRCVVTPKDGARVSLQLTLPDAPQPLLRNRQKKSSPFSREPPASAAPALAGGSRLNDPICWERIAETAPPAT